MRRRGQRVQLGVLAALVAVSVAGALEGAEAPTVTIPRVPRAPELDDFLEMKPNAEMAGKLAKVEGFIQQRPSDGKPSTRHTEVYVGYDDKNLYVVFICFEPEAGQVRARMSPRENIFGDDIVEVMLDTFKDERRAYAFITNPFGIQWDALWTEGQGFDSSFDTLWHSRGKVTDQGYVVWMAIPFKSLRFSSAPQQTWGLIFLREMPRLNEETFWPHISSRIEGRLNQAATLKGLENISPGRNVQLIPYGIFRSDRTLDTRDPLRPRFDRNRFEGDGGLDAKIVFKDALVMDIALNPDFSQVESDEPQVTVNQRFEVFFPEKRPFFLENASYFNTPIDLVFTRRIADPQFGVRGTGKLGKWALGAFAIDDEAPGKLVTPDDPLHGQRALFGILRVNRDIGEQSTLGFILTDREFEGVYNRIGGVDGRFKLNENWTAEFQAVTSWTRCFPVSDFATRGSGRQAIDGCFRGDEGKLAGPAYQAEIERSGRQFNYELEYNDFSRGYRTATGFLRRPDIRRVGQQVGYGFRPEGKYFISWGPFFNTEAVFDHSGTRLDFVHDSSITFEFIGGTEVGALFNYDRERLRPVDFPVLTENMDFSRNRKGFFWATQYLRQVSFFGSYTWGTRINFVPPAGQSPELADITTGNLGLTLRPTTRLRIDNTYLWFRLKDRATEESVFNNHIIRSKWNYQFTRELSLRMILQYDAVLANPAHTVLTTSKNFNADFLITYLVHPGTVLFVGYNGNAQNIFLCEGPGIAASDCPTLPAEQAALIQRRRAFINDAGQFFVKFSYLLRF